jgi:hypothetical protein
MVGFGHNALSRMERTLSLASSGHLLARLVRTWKQALLLVQPDTLLRWHREPFRLIWKRGSTPVSSQPKVALETIALIREIVNVTMDMMKLALNLTNL